MRQRVPNIIWMSDRLNRRPIEILQIIQFSQLKWEIFVFNFKILIRLYLEEILRVIFKTNLHFDDNSKRSLQVSQCF